MALWTRRKSTCLRTTSSGSVTLIATGSHVTCPLVQALSAIWTARMVASVGMTVATGPFRSLFPASVRVGRGVSALPDPAHRHIRRGHHRRLVLAIAPGAARAVVVMMFPAGNADHALYCAAGRERIVPLQRARPDARPRAGSASPCCLPIISNEPDACPRQCWWHDKRRSPRNLVRGGAARALAGSRLKRRWRGASDGGAQPSARPRSARPRCRTSPAATLRNSGIQAAPGKQRRLP